MLKYMETNQGLPESQSEISAGLRTGRTPVNGLIFWEFLKICAMQMCICVYILSVYVLLAYLV